MAYIIAVAGKGGTGKTTISALLIRLLKENKKGAILAIDADPNSNLAEVLGVNVQQTIGSILDEIAANPQGIPSGMTKERFIEYQVQSTVIETDGFDILTMGKPEGPGCYCYVNNVLRNMMAKLIKDYDFIVIDNEAGLEHLSRRTTRMADALLVVSDPSSVGLKAAARIAKLVEDLKIDIKKKLLVVNKRSREVGDTKLPNCDLNFIGSLPQDDQLAVLSLEDGSVIKLDKDALSLKALHNLGEQIWQKI